MARIRFRPDMTPELQNLMNLLYQRTEEQRKRQEMLNRLKSMTGLFGDTGSAYMSGIDLETGMPKISFRSPEEQQAMIFQNRLKDYFAAKRLGQSMTGERYRTLTPEQKMQFIKARETYKTGLPEFGGRQFLQSESGKYKEIKPSLISAKGGTQQVSLVNEDTGEVMTLNVPAGKVYKRADFETRQLQKAKGQVAGQQLKQQKQAEIDFLTAKNKLRTTFGAFKAMTQAAGGAGRIKGLIGSELAGRAGINPYTQAYKGQLVEAAASLAKLASPSARVGQEIIQMFKQTLPTVLSTEPEALNQIRFSLHNAFATVLAKNGQSYTEETQKIIDDMFDEIANVEPLSLEGKGQRITPKGNKFKIIQ